GNYECAGTPLRVLPEIVRGSHREIILAKEDRWARREDQTVKKNNESRLFEILQLRVLDLAVDLRHRLFAAHREDGVAEANQDADESDRVRKPCVLGPAERVFRIRNG